MHSGVRMAAEDAVGTMQSGIEECPGRNFLRHPEPTSIEAIDHTGHGLALEIEFLQLEVEQSSEIAQVNAVNAEAVKLMAMNGEMAQARVLPAILLINGNAD